MEMEQTAIPAGYPIENFSGYEAYSDGRVVRLADSKEMHPNKKGVITIKNDSGELEEIVHAELIGAINAAIEAAKNPYADRAYQEAERDFNAKIAEMRTSLKLLQKESLTFAREGDRKADDFFLRCGKYSIEITALEDSIKEFAKTHPKFAKKKTAMEGNHAEKRARAAKVIEMELTEEQKELVAQYDAAKAEYDAFIAEGAGKSLKAKLDLAASNVKFLKKTSRKISPVPVGNFDNLGSGVVKKAVYFAAMAIKMRGDYVSQNQVQKELNKVKEDGTPLYDVNLPVSMGRIPQYLQEWKVSNPDPEEA